MSLKAMDAATAYAKAVANIKQPGLEARDGLPKGNFASLVQDAVEGAAESLQTSEKLTMKAMTKEADLLDVVTAVTNAEMTLQTVVAVRDRVVQAYQDIIKMPI